MAPMFCASITRIRIAAAALAIVVGSMPVIAQDSSITRSRKFKIPPPSARFEVTVVRDANGKPIEAAAVIFHPIEGDRDKGTMELKTNEDGKAMLDIIPMGDTIRLQVIAKGFQTYGHDYIVDTPSITLEIRMKRPGEQYSIYKQHAASPDAKTTSGSDNATKPATEDTQKPTGNDKQPDAGSQSKPNN
jgi:hypothetical protein